MKQNKADRKGLWRLSEGKIAGVIDFEMEISRDTGGEKAVITCGYVFCCHCGIKQAVPVCPRGSSYS